MKWFAEASGLCKKRKRAPTDLRKFVDLYGEKWKIKDCGLIRKLYEKHVAVATVPKRQVRTLKSRYALGYGMSL